MKTVVPNLKLSKAQKQVVMNRVMEKSPMARQPLAQMGGTPIPSLAPNTSNPSPLASGSSMPTMPSIEAVNANNAPVSDPLDQLKSIQPKGQPITQQAGEMSEVDKQIQSALIADQLWKDSGGEGSIAETIWSKYRRASNSPHLESTRDYFVSIFVKWKSDPEKFRKAHPKEAALLKQLNDEFEAAQTPIPAEGVGGISGPIR